MLFAQMVPILAQAGGRGGGGGGDGGEAGGAIMGMLCMVGYFAILIAAIVASIMFLLTLYKALNECAPENRTMEPGQVWLTFIPLVGIVFYIMAVFKVPDSLANEYRDRGIRTDSDFGKNNALWYILGYFICFPVGLVFWIMYWRQVAGHVKELQGKSGSSRGRGDDDEDEDERPSKRKSKYADDDEDDRPSKRRRRDEDDEDEDDRPSKRRRRDDDD